MSIDSNFAPLDRIQPELARLGRQAEAVFSIDPRAAMVRLRLFGEKLAIYLLDLARLSVFDESQHDRLRRLSIEGVLDDEASEHLHRLRREGNKAAHDVEVGHREAMRMLRSSHVLVRWTWTHHSDRGGPPPGSFVRPTARAAKEDARLRALSDELEQERQRAAAAQDEAADLIRLLAMPQVATWHGLEVAYQALGEEEQDRVGSFLLRFREEPIHGDWPLEPVPQAEDDKVRVVAIGDLRLVVVHPPRADLIMVVHVAPEADALTWAAHRRFEVNPYLGTIQVFDVRQAEEAVADAPQTSDSLFAHRPDDELLAIGLPEALLPAVRAVSTPDVLDGLLPHLPPEAGDALYLMLGKASLDAIRDQLDQSPAEQVDAEDFAAAVHHPQTKRSFLLLEDDTDLQAVLEGSLEAWRLYLHPDQRKLVQMKANGPIRVLGGAGTGKTVALLHRAAHLLQEVHTDPDHGILVTTFTRNLASDLRTQLSRMLSPSDLGRVDALNLDALATGLWHAHGDGRTPAKDARKAAAWTTAMHEETLDLTLPFYRDELSEVVLAQGITDEINYLRARRTGRGVGLSRSRRRAVWKVLDAYRKALQQRGLIEYDDALQQLTEGLESGSIPRQHVSALADEVQDFGAPQLRLLRALVPQGTDDLFLVGDTHQRIYGSPLRMSHCGIEIRGRSRRLRVNYRTTARVRSWAVSALEGESFDDMDGGEDDLDGYRSLRLGVEPEVSLVPTRQAEREAVMEHVRSWLGDGGAPEALCIAAPTSRLVKDMKEFLDKHGVVNTVITTEDAGAGDGIRLATFHRLKGLEFPKVVLTSIQKDLMPMRVRAYYDLDEAGRALWDKRQRCLLYVAATRARDELVVLGSGKPSPFLVGPSSR